MSRCTLIFLLLCISQSTFSQYIITGGDSAVLDNGLIRRVIRLRDAIYTEQLLLSGCSQNFVGIDYPLKSRPKTSALESTQPTNYSRPRSPEFSLSIDDVICTGASGWKTGDISVLPADYEGNSLKVQLNGSKPETEGIELIFSYTIYPDLPVIRKQIEITNHRNKEVKIEALDVEYLHLPWSETHNVTLADFGRQKRLGPYIGNAYDPVVVAHDVTGRRGIAVGNEAPGVMKRTAVMVDGIALQAGLTHPEQSYPFRRWLSQDEKWKSPGVFMALYAGTDDAYTGINGPVNDYVRRHLGSRISIISDKPIFVYNTWNPFMGNINDGMIREIAKAASECGVEEFIIDAGWYKNATGWEDSTDNWFNECGDWLIDEKKFPGGLKPVFDYIKSLGMKPGLWVSLGNASVNSKVYNEHPEYFTARADGGNMFLHVASDAENASGCFSSNWPEYIGDVILHMVRDYGLAYAKLDLAVVTSPYHYDPARTGCYASGHKHKDWEESLLMNFEELFKTFDQLHAEAPDLFIDCTFETMGALQLIDYAMCQHAEGNWLSNFEELSPSGNLRMRQMAWWRSPAIPASSLVIGNPRMDDPDPILYFKSLAGALPIMLGDPRKLTTGQKAEYKQVADWLRSMQEKYNYAIFRQDLAGFGEPMEGHWDGFQRINSDTKFGGIVGIFRQGAAEEKRKVTVQWLDPLANYTVLSAPEGKQIVRLSGKELMEKGFEVKLLKKYDGALFEIRRVK